MNRTVFYLSDSTGITAETLGNALLTQFDNLDYRQVTIPFVRDEARAEEAVAEINRVADEDGHRPIVFSTLPASEVYDKIAGCRGLVLDLFNSFLRPLELEFNRGSTHATGRFHGLVDRVSYEIRIDAVDFALKHDDGSGPRGYKEADVILVGVSRSGKTPTCVYLSMQFGIRAANYPLTADDLDGTGLPGVLRGHIPKIFGLTIAPERLRQIRQERRPNSRYASLAQCRREVGEVEAIFRLEGIPYINTDTISIEEIATRVLQQTGLKRRLRA